MNNLLRDLSWFSDWLDDREATRQSRKLHQVYAPKVADAEKAKKWNERQELLSEWQFEDQQFTDPVYARKAERLTAKARKYGITVPPKPAHEDVGESNDWDLSNATGEWLLTRSAEERLRREIKIEARASYDEFRKWATLAFAVVGSALAFVSVLSKARQPDPCPRNYYRADSGECVFASQKNVAQPQSPPSPMAQPDGRDKEPKKPDTKETPSNSAH